MSKYYKWIITSIVFWGASLVLIALKDVYSEYDSYEILTSIASVGVTVSPIVFVVALVKGIKNSSEHEKSVKPTVLPRYYVPAADYYAVDKEYRKLNSDSGMKDKDYHLPNDDWFTLLRTTTTHDQSYPISYYYEVQISKEDGKLYFVQAERLDSGEEKRFVKYNSIPIEYEEFKNLCQLMKKPGKELASLNENNWKQFLAKYGIYGNAVYLTHKECLGVDFAPSSFAQNSSFHWYTDNSQNNYVIEFSCGNAGFGVFVYCFGNENPPTDYKKLKDVLYNGRNKPMHQKNYIIKMDTNDYLKKLPNLQDFCHNCRKRFTVDVYTDIYYYDLGVYCSECFIEKVEIDKADNIYVIKPA